MSAGNVSYNDLEEIRKLQPEGWPDIVRDFRFYLESDFCLPLKMVLGNRIVGIGAAIILGDTAWIAHIIVDKEFRNKGIGTALVEELMKELNKWPLRSYLLIATDMGKSLYEKAGFRAVSEYAYFKRDRPWKEQHGPRQVQAFKNDFTTPILELDRHISGEDRRALLYDHLAGAKVYIRNKSIEGVYLPEPGEGMIIADNQEAGIELMKLKYAAIHIAVLPAENAAGISFLEHHGFTRTPVKGTRMVHGEDVPWKPDKIFSRIGGNLG